MTEKNEFDALKQLFNDPRIGAKFLNIVADVKDLGSAISEKLKSKECQDEINKVKSTLGLDSCHGCDGKGWITIGKDEALRPTMCPICNGTGKKQDEQKTV